MISPPVLFLSLCSNTDVALSNEKENLRGITQELTSVTVNRNNVSELFLETQLRIKLDNIPRCRNNNFKKHHGRTGYADRFQK